MPARRLSAAKITRRACRRDGREMRIMGAPFEREKGRAGSPARSFYTSLVPGGAVRAPRQGDCMKEPLPSGHTETIDDIEMYYETRGDGEPLVLLHGGGGAGANWKLIFEEPPEGYQLIIP